MLWAGGLWSYTMANYYCGVNAWDKWLGLKLSKIDDVISLDKVEKIWSNCIEMLRARVFAQRESFPFEYGILPTKITHEMYIRIYELTIAFTHYQSPLWTHSSDFYSVSCSPSPYALYDFPRNPNLHHAVVSVPFPIFSAFSFALTFSTCFFFRSPSRSQDFRRSLCWYLRVYYCRFLKVFVQ